ncbi:MAG: AMP-binding protein [Polyangiaceae bacterium]|nr:AMP-binding protein [Polyangiaceae bacterium]
MTTRANGKPNGQRPPLDLEAVLAGRRLVVIGGTGFLGKVWWAHLLYHYPGIGHIHLLVRPRKGLTAEQRFWKEVVTSEVLQPLRDRHGSGFAAFLRGKVTPVAGDVGLMVCGLASEVRDALRGRIDAVVNSAGVVDFDPPIDEALEVNAFGVQNLVALTRDLGAVPLLHTSTCFVAGDRTGNVEELDPRDFPFPRADELDRSHWDPDREIDECLDVVRQARQRADDAFRQSHFLDQAKKNLRDRCEPTLGGALEAELAKVKRQFVEEQLSATGMERAQFWGFPNTYTYTKSIGEQIIAASGLRFAIVRPAIIESTIKFPFPAWNEGINTSAPLIYSLREGQPQIPGSDNNLDFIPCDMVAGGMTLALGELIEGTAAPVYQLGTSDVNPCSMKRFFELSGLYKRKYYQRTGRGGVVGSFINAHFEGALLNEEQFRAYGTPVLVKGTGWLAGALKQGAVGPAATLLGPVSRALGDFSKQQAKVGSVLETFLPFICRYHYTFRCGNVRAAVARLGERDRARINWTPESIDWRTWFLECHAPALEQFVFPQIDAKVKKKAKAPVAHDNLVNLIEDMAERYDLAVALQRTEADGLSRISYRDLRARALACAGRLQALGIEPGDRVLLAGHNHPAWPVSFFGILAAGASVVPLDGNVDALVAQNLCEASGARVFIADAPVVRRVSTRIGDRLAWLDLEAAAEPGPSGKRADVKPDDVAALIYTSGTTGRPKGVMLTHRNVTALVAALAPLFPLSTGDRVLSVLPLHHTFELTCGMLLPISRGARVVYIDELTAERLEYGLKEGRITALVGVPALWEMLERRIFAKVNERGRVVSTAFDLALDANRAFGKAMGADAGRLLFGPVHAGLGGHLRYLVSGGAALPERTHQAFAGLGLHLAEGYGLTEAAPVLTVARPGPKARAGHVGKPIPGVEVKILNPGKDGVGEVIARGPNVMLGYAGDVEATRESIDAEGWLHTGDLGRFDKRGHLVIVGRAKDTIVTATGENVYPDDVEARLGKVEHIKELAVLAVSDPRGGERIACMAMVEEDEAATRDERHDRAKKALDKALLGLPVHMRPAVVRLTDLPLPRTATKKVRRPDVRHTIEQAEGSGSLRPFVGSDKLDSAAQLVRRAAATIARRQPSELSAATSLRGDLGFDSLMLLELLVALEQQTGTSVDAEKLNDCNTIGDAEDLVRTATHTRRHDGGTEAVEKEDERAIEVPRPVREVAMTWLGQAQMGFYDRLLDVDVSGRAHIPHNRPTLVVANHASHLDMGLVKYALGSYGEDIVSLAAQDYFFEGNKWRRGFFENFTNLQPLSRTGSLRDSLDKAAEKLAEGRTVLVFPEGTRSADGEVHEFKAVVGHLALQHQVDLLPVWLGGTHLAFPKGARMLKRRDVKARIGLPLTIVDLRRLTEGRTPSEASRVVAKLAERAVRELSQGRLLDLSAIAKVEVEPEEKPESLAEVFAELRDRFVAGAVEKPVSYYFALGEDRWTVKVSHSACEVMPGKVVNPADCVLKTSPDIFTRIVREAYTPSPAEFVSGAVKSNNINLLFTFQKVFQLQGDAE